MSGAQPDPGRERALAILLAVGTIGLVLAFAGELLSVAIDALGSPGPVLAVLVVGIVLLWLFDKV